MNDAEIITKTRAYAEEVMRGETSGHDWWHVYRVEKLAVKFAQEEKGADLLVVRLAALLHDIADWKFHNGDTEVGPRKAREFLSGLGVDPEIVARVEYIVRHISFRGGTNKHAMETIEGKIVQDADRLDALGAIGIARAFAFGGSVAREMYDPENKPRDFKSFEEYQKSVTDNTTINHFYEKLLLLKDRMNTESARRFAQKRHDYTVQFLDEFYAEFEGQR